MKSERMLTKINSLGSVMRPVRIISLAADIRVETGLNFVIVEKIPPLGDEYKTGVKKRRKVATIVTNLPMSLIKTFKMEKNNPKPRVNNTNGRRTNGRKITVQDGTILYIMNIKITRHNLTKNSTII